jgi:hypothetical protein
MPASAFVASSAPARAGEPAPQAIMTKVKEEPQDLHVFSPF